MDDGESNVDDNDDDGDKNNNNDNYDVDDDDVRTPPASSCLPAGRTNGRGISKRTLKVKTTSRLIWEHLKKIMRIIKQQQAAC